MLGHYFMFQGNCFDALETYQKAFDAKIIELQRYSDMPPDPAFPIPDSQKNLVLHAKIEIDGCELMCADGSSQSKMGDNMFVSITTSDMSYVQKAWEILKKDGDIYMKLAPSFFAAAHGSLRDRYGINWMFTVLKKDMK